jgi:type I restriction enzyme M protein
MTDKATLDYSALVNVISNEFRHYNTGITSASIKEKILLLLYIKYLNDRSTAGNEVNLFQELPKEASWSLIRESATDTNYKLESAFWALAETNRDFQKLLAKFPFDNNPFQKELDAFLFKITQCLSNYDLNISQENFGLLFDQLFKKLGDSPSFEDEIMPRELVDLMLAFKPNKDQPAIYNPYAGLASIPIALKGYKNYFGQTLNKKALSIAELRLLAYGINQEFQLESTNPIEFLTELGKDKSYDFIISNPPFRVKLNKLKSRHSGSGQKMLEGFLLEQSAKILSEQGVAVVAVSGGFLSSGGVEQKLRQQLIESDLVETVVALPVKLFEATGIPIYLVVLNKNKANRNKVRFIDASEFLIEKTKRLNHIDIAKVLPLIKQDENSKSVHFSDTSEIKKNDFNLTPKRYIPLEFESSTSKDENTWLALNKVLERISPYRIKEVEKGRFIRISNLSSSIKDSQTSFDEIEETELPKSVSLLPNQCLILATKYKDLKPTYFSGNDEPVFTTQVTWRLLGLMIS